MSSESLRGSWRYLLPTLRAPENDAAVITCCREALPIRREGERVDLARVPLRFHRHQHHASQGNG
jgi:hypothetical protein